MALAFLVGVLFKVYDDFVDDEQILTDEYGVTALRTLQSALSAVVLANDFGLCLVFALFNGLCALSSVQEYSRPHVVSYAVLSPILLALSWPTRPSLGSTDWAVIVGLLGLALFEPKAFPEETSWLKGVSRLWGAVVLLTAVRVIPRLSPSVVSALLMFAGYSLASSMAQMLKLTGLIRASTPTPA